MGVLRVAGGFVKTVIFTKTAQLEPFISALFSLSGNGLHQLHAMLKAIDRNTFAAAALAMLAAPRLQHSSAFNSGSAKACAGHKAISKPSLSSKSEPSPSM